MDTKSAQRMFLLVAGISVLVLLTATNPTQSDYDLWAAGNLSGRSGNPLVKASAISMVGPPVIDQITESKNYLLFSVYDTNYRDDGFQTIGIFNHFIVVKKPPYEPDS